MKKYWIIITNEIQRQFTQRFNMIAYAFGNIIELVSLVVIWSIVYGSVSTIQGYSFMEMITYVVFSWFFAFLTTTYAFEQNIARDIHLGLLSNFMVKPLSYIKYIAALSLGRIFIAFLIVIIQGFLMIYLFRDKLIFDFSVVKAVLIIGMLIVTYFINLFLSILIGLIAFWTTEISGIYYSLKVFIKFVSGAYFPLNLLPLIFLKISLFLPFAYTVYVPVQLYLGKISLSEGLRGLGIELVWLVILYGIIKVVWRFGLKKYESVGI